MSIVKSVTKKSHPANRPEGIKDSIRMRKRAQNKACTTSCLYGIFPDDRTKWHRIQGTISALTWGSMPVTSVFLSLFIGIILSSSSDRTFFPVFIFLIGAIRSIR